MTDQQWQTLVNAVNGGSDSPVVGFVVDSPWIPNWFGISILDYFTSDELWFEANLSVQQAFPDCLFLPGFWSEYGMCTEPSAFGVRCVFPSNDFPTPKSDPSMLERLDSLTKPNPREDGLLPFTINRQRLLRDRIRQTGHEIRLAVARGPLNIASFLAGTTEFLLAAKLEPQKAHDFLSLITDFLDDWITYQFECFPSIDGVFLLDDIVGFLGEDDFLSLAFPYFKRLYERFPATVRMFHNDAPCKVSAPHLAAMGVNLFNFGTDLAFNEARELCGDEIALMGNVPPRDVLAQGTPAEISAAVRDQITSAPTLRRTVLSCGGGMPPGVSTQNLNAFLEAAGVKSR